MVLAFVVKRPASKKLVNVGRSKRLQEQSVSKRISERILNLLMKLGPHREYNNTALAHLAKPLAQPDYCALNSGVVGRRHFVQSIQKDKEARVFGIGVKTL